MPTKLIEHYIQDAWTPPEGKGKMLYHAITGAEIGSCSSDGMDWEAILEYGRKIGGPPLRKMSFHERGRMLKAIALHLYDQKEIFYQLSTATGATRADSWIDIEGGIGNLFSYASLRKKFPDKPFYIDGEGHSLSKGANFMGHHIMLPKEGVAIHINAFNFPVWGMLEKVAVNWLAGVPAIVKPAEEGSFLTEMVVRSIIDSGILPPGALQMVNGSGIGILDHVMEQDVVTFTGSASTGKMLKAHPAIIESSVPFTMEADSLNCAILGKDVKSSSPEFELFIKEVRKEMTVKCGQKCTAIRRIIVPEHMIEEVQQALIDQLGKTVIGHPDEEGVKMGALISKDQQQEVRSRIKDLTEFAQIVYGDPDLCEVKGANFQSGAFMAPVLLRTDHPMLEAQVHEIEAFGPVATLMPYHELEEAIELSKMGKGSLCCSIVTGEHKQAKEFVYGAAPHHGRILVLNASSAKESTGHGSPLPLLVHGGPGRAGGGEEMGGMRGVMHYLQRTAIQGDPTTISAITEVYQENAAMKKAEKHLFRQYFEELEIGDTVFTHKRTIIESDIVQFANVSWDHFYAHTDVTSLEGTVFEQRVAHGYFLLSAAAGLFVDPGKGPVMLNYGLEECRFIKPVYAGTTIGVKLTVKEKIGQERRGEDDIAKGIVKFRVEVYDQEDEIVALATILTMVKKRDQSI